MKNKTKDVSVVSTSKKKNGSSNVLSDLYSCLKTVSKAKICTSIALAAILISPNLKAENKTVNQKELKVLTIGNSFADSVFNYLPSIVKSVPDTKIVMKRANIGGCYLEKHWNEVLKSEKDPTYKPYWDKYNLKEMLELKKWDIVTLQQVSSKSFLLESYEPWFNNLHSYVKKYAPQAEIVIQMTWSYRAEHVAFGNWGVSDQVDMFNKLSAAYTSIAKKYNCRIIPCGLALNMARKEQTTQFVKQEKPDFSKYTYPEIPEVPKGSFIKGYHWRKDKEGVQKMSSDLIHLNKRGEYLQACVWFAKLFNKPTSKISYVPEVVDVEDAAFLRTIAQKAVDSSNASCVTVKKVAKAK